MNVVEQAQRVWTNLLQLGTKKLVALAAIGVAIFALTGIGGYYLSRPSMETLYAGLDRQDVSSIGAALRDADIPFDASSDGTSVLVRYGQTAQARMLLAEKGLPHSSNAGYELYDKLGSLGLTSFMQDVTRVRALEGELARTIQDMEGVKAARVHIVMPNEGSFRRVSQPASASVVIRADTADENRTAQAIRHLVAAAVPGMKLEEVTVLSTDGSILATGDDASNGAPNRMLDLEKMVGRSVTDNIRRTLVPEVGTDNLQISVSAKLNTDQKQTAETTYNPDGRVERSVRTVKDLQNSQNSTSASPTTVNQNVPTTKPQSSDGKQSTEQNDKREELTNYEISNKTVTTISAGYQIDHLSIAVVLNRSALAAALGGKASDDVINKKLADVEQLVGSAAGFDKSRGDSLKVMAVDFVNNGKELDPVPTVGLMEALTRQSGTLINAFMVLAVTVVVVMFGVRPLVRVLSSGGASTEIAASDEIILPDLPDLPSLGSPDGAMGMGGMGGEGQLGMDGWGSEQSLIEDLTNTPRRSPQKRLEQMIEFDEEQAAAVLKQWMREEVAA